DPLDPQVIYDLRTTLQPFFEDRSTCTFDKIISDKFLSCECSVTLQSTDGATKHAFDFCGPSIKGKNFSYTLYGDPTGGWGAHINLGDRCNLVIDRLGRLDRYVTGECKVKVPPSRCCCTEIEKGSATTKYDCTLRTGAVDGGACAAGEKSFPVPSSGSCDALTVTKDPNVGDQTVGIGTDKLLSDARDLNQLNRFTQGSPRDTVRTLIGQVIRVLTAFMGSILLVLYIYAGVLWMTAAGNSEQVDKAKQIFVWSTLGIVVVLGSYIIADFIFTGSGLIR
ncbi:MAG TPA: pilin, partial [Patescibacteria group bacterium]|nr:pilin [Patescibacteria group bacterium]